MKCARGNLRAHVEIKWARRFGSNQEECQPTMNLAPKTACMRRDDCAGCFGEAGWNWSVFKLDVADGVPRNLCCRKLSQLLPKRRKVLPARANCCPRILLISQFLPNLSFRWVFSQISNFTIHLQIKWIHHHELETIQQKKKWFASWFPSLNVNAAI